MGAENYAEWREATRNPDVVRAMLEDYRAGLSRDRAENVSGHGIDSGHHVAEEVPDELAAARQILPDALTITLFTPQIRRKWPKLLR